MPRYFFTIHRRDRVEDDPAGTYLPDAEAALSYAEYTIRELRKKSGYKDDLALMMMVNVRMGSLPFTTRGAAQHSGGQGEDFPGPLMNEHA